MEGSHGSWRFRSARKLLATVLSLTLMAVGLPAVPALAAGVPTVGNAAGSVTADAGGAPVVISPNITLSNFDAIDGATVTINGGFAAGEDVLAFTSQGGISGSYNAGNGVLTLTGTADAATYQTALRSVTYQNTNAATRNTAPRGITFSVGSGTLYYQGTGHYYQYVARAGIHWTDARDAAASSSLYGLHGYLATITSAGENGFVAAKVQGLGWIGASDAAQEGVWQWVTGPEAGTQFSNQYKWGWCSANTAPGINGQYAAWHAGEPNDCGYNEDYGHYYTDGTWNDFANDNGSIQGYVVEYGGMPGDSAPVLQASTTVLIAPDTTGPIVSVSLSGPQGQNSWYTGPVSVQITATDDKSGVASIQYAVDGGTTQSVPGASAVVPVPADGKHTVTYGATDKAGNLSSLNQPYTVNSLLDSWQDTGIDVTAGTALHITATGSITCDYRRTDCSSTPDGSNLGYTGFVSSLRFASLVGKIGGGQPFLVGSNYQGSSSTGGRLYLGYNDCAGCFWDNAGSWAVTVVQGQAVTFQIDSTKPTITGSPSTTNWTSQPVTVTYTCTDVTSGIAVCQAPMTVSAEGANQSVTGSATDKAGNTATATVDGIRIDLSAPVTAISAPTAWQNHDVPVTLTATDSLSGVAATYYTVDGGAQQSGTSFTIATEGTHTVTFWSVDVAGNTEAAHTATVLIDKTVPTIDGAPDRAANAAGWYNAAVTVTFTCTDSGSGIATCANAQTLSEGANQSATGTATDKAGNSASATVSGINVDMTAPAITGAPDRAANAAGWYNADVTVSFTCGDALSGLAACAGAQTLGEGANQSVTGSAADKAGNTASATVSGINVDKTAPTISGSTDRAANAAGWYNGAVTVTFTCGDGLSGVANCAAPVTLSGAGAGQSATGTVTDKAGNTTSATVSGINIDLTAPAVTYTGNAGTYTVDQQVNITCTAADDLSGVAATTCANVTGPAYSFSLGANSFSAGATDKAGNAGTGSTSFTVTVNTTSLCSLSRQFAPGALGDSLCAKLAVIGKTLAKGQAGTAANQIEAFVNEVQAQSGKALTTQQADVLIRLARSL